MKVGNKEVILQPYTRRIARLVEAELLKGVVAETDEIGTPRTSVPAINGSNSETLLVSLMSGLSSDELDDLSNADYESLKEEIVRVVNEKKN